MEHNEVRPAPPVIHVTRSKVYPQPARPGFAWHWLYDTDSPGRYPIGGYDRLDSLRMYLKRQFPGCTIITTWNSLTKEERQTLENIVDNLLEEREQKGTQAEIKISHLAGEALRLAAFHVRRIDYVTASTEVRRQMKKRGWRVS